MKLILSTENAFKTIKLREQLIKALKGELDNIKIDTWAYTKSNENYDIIYHNPSQYVDAPDKNVLFNLEVDDSIVQFSIVWWAKNPEPSEEIKCLHVGRLTEMLLRYFRGEYIKLSVID